jgi:hypothetical protein
MGIAEEAVLKKGASGSDPPSWVASYSKLNFFFRLLRCLKYRKRKSNGLLMGIPALESVDIPPISEVSEDPREHNEISPEVNFNEETQQEDCPSIGTRSLINEGESRDHGSALRHAVKELHFGSLDEKFEAAIEIQRLAKENVKTRKSLAVLGVIPSLVAMLSSTVPDHCHASLQALIELASGNYTNKGLIVEAGVLEKLTRFVDTSDSEIQEKIAILLLALSAVDKNKSIIGSSAVLPALVCMLESGTDKGKMASLAALYNLSTCLDNVDSILAKGAVQPLLKMAQSLKTGERALGILGNLVLTKSGRKAIECSANMPKCLIDILGWESSPRCQELAAYILMLLAHRSLIQRKTMMQEGIVPALLELALLGTTLAQKRAMRILQWLRDDKQGAMMPVSGPVTARAWEPRREFSSPEKVTEMEDNKRAIKNMVQKSLQWNMDHIVKRADVSSTCVDSSTRLKSLISSSSSKSLPY